jgi:hypothetical protein
MVLGLMLVLLLVNARGREVHVEQVRVREANEG